MTTARNHPPQAFISSYAPRLRKYANHLIQPIPPAPTAIPGGRITKRGTTAINYAEDGYEDDDFEDSEGPRRATGLRSLRRQQQQQEDPLHQFKELNKEANAPVETQGIWRDWMAKPGKLITEKQQQIQCVLPLHLVPIRIDVDVPSFRPDPPLPAPQNPDQYGIDINLPAYRVGELTPAFRVKDAFLWNLHEALITPDQFAKRMVEELDFPMNVRIQLIPQIATQIRTQLENHAEVQLHPLFQSAPSQDPPPASSQTANGTPVPIAQNGTPAPLPPPPQQPFTNGYTAQPSASSTEPTVTTTATLPIPPQPPTSLLPTDPHPHNPPDPSRILLTLSVHLHTHLYTDHLEWSLSHPPGYAETFARTTCADLGLGPEWVMAISVSIYEAVLRLKRDILENGGLPVGQGYGVHGEVDNEAAWGADAGVRYDPENGLGEMWAPSLEVLRKEEVEKREADRERRIRRAKRDTARFTNLGYTIGGAGGAGGGGAGTPGGGGGLFDQFTDPTESERMGRGERRKTKRRFRSLSPGGRETPDAGGPGGMGTLTEQERPTYRCAHCGLWGTAIWGVKDGPGVLDPQQFQFDPSTTSTSGPGPSAANNGVGAAGITKLDTHLHRQLQDPRERKRLGTRSLCQNCGYLWDRDGRLPPWNLDFFRGEGVPVPGGLALGLGQSVRR